MDHDITIIENFLSDDECDFLIDFFKKASHKEVWESTSILWLKKQPFNLRLSYIRFKCTYRIKKKFKIRLLNANKVLNFTKTPGYEHLFT